MMATAKLIPTNFNVWISTLSAALCLGIVERIDPIDKKIDERNLNDVCKSRWLFRKGEEVTAL